MLGTSSLHHPCRRHVLRLGLGALPLLLAARPGQAAQDGLVAWIRGAATASRSGATRQLHAGAAVQAGDSIVTLAGARLRLAFADGSTLAIGETSQLVITRLDDIAGSTVFDLIAGILRATLGTTPPDVFAVRGRAAIAAARSTDFIVETTSSTTSTFVVDGTVEVTALYGGGGGLLGAGDGIDIERGKPPGAVRRWGQRRVEDVMDRTAVAG